MNEVWSNRDAKFAAHLELDRVMLPRHPKPTLTKPPFPIFRFLRFLALTVRTFRVSCFFGVFFAVFPVFCSMSGLICMFRILYGLNMRK